MEMELDRLGTFDVVLYLGVLYHMQNPLLTLQRLAQVTKWKAIIETQAVYLRGSEDRALCEFYKGAELEGDVTNWWSPNMRALCDMCFAAGFSRVDPKSGPVRTWAVSRQGFLRYRAIVHATRDNLVEQ